MGRKIELLAKFPKFVGVNFIGTAVDTAVLWIFSHFVFDTYVGDYIVSPVISFEFAVLTNYICSSFFVWKDRVDRSSFSTFFKKYLPYNLSSSAVFLIKMGILLLIELISGWNVVICNLVALCISGLINFSMGEWVIFRKRKQ